MIHIGIDTGVNTGIAVWVSKSHQGVEDYARGKLAHVSSGTIWQAVDTINIWRTGNDVTLHIEDARKAHFWKHEDYLKAQGAGSVKRDASIWEQFAIHYGFPYVLHRPKMGKKVNAEMFKRLTGWQGRTNSHARDAALLVFGMK